MTEPAALTQLRAQRLLAVIRAPAPEVALAAARAVARGGIPLLEVTFTVPEAARFIVAPNLSDEVASAATGAPGVLFCPGAYTTTEILAARAAGAHLVKVYPVGVAGGPAYIRVIRDPLPGVPMLAAGGTSLDNAAAFLDAGCVGLGLGGSLADPALAVAGRFDEIAARAAAFVRTVAAWRAA